jgi:hypothetical protein
VERGPATREVGEGVGPEVIVSEASSDNFVTRSSSRSPGRHRDGRPWRSRDNNHGSALGHVDESGEAEVQRADVPLRRALITDSTAEEIGTAQ